MNRPCFDFADAPSGLPFLEHFPEPGGPLQRVLLNRLPFRLGRDAGADLVVYSARVSKAHAAVVRWDEGVGITDLGSTNGTFVNGRRVESALLTDGDIIHLAQKEFRFGWELGGQPDAPVTEETALSRPRSLIQEAAHLRELIAEGMVASLFQPIVSLADRTVVAFEALGRGQHPDLPTAPGPLFALAERCQLAVELSRAFRAAAVAAEPGLPGPQALFLNVHPVELLPGRLPLLLDDLPGLAAGLGAHGRPLVLEVHEDFAADLATFEGLRALLRGLGVRLAYDDFGAGQARLATVTHVAADFVKLDRALVQALPGSRALRDLVQALARVCADLGSQLLAEGIETEQQAAVSAELGCSLGQGFLFSPPCPAEQLDLNAECGRLLLS